MLKWEELVTQWIILFYHLIEYVYVIHPRETVSYTYVSFNMLFIMFIDEAFRSSIVDKIIQGLRS